MVLLSVVHLLESQGSFQGVALVSVLVHLDVLLLVAQNVIELVLLRKVANRWVAFVYLDLKLLLLLLRISELRVQITHLKLPNLFLTFVVFFHLQIL